MKSSLYAPKSRYALLNLEKRKYPRFTVNLPVEYCRVECPVANACQALDISSGGLLIYLPERIDLDQRLRLKLFLSIGSELNAIEILTKVAWIEMHPQEDWGYYRTGVELVTISMDDMAKLKHFLKSLL